MRAKVVPLGSVAEVNPRTPASFLPDELCSFVPMEAVDEVSATIATTKVRPYNELKTGYTRFSADDVLVAKITPCMENGKCALAGNLLNGVGFGSTEFHVLRASNQVLPEWLFFFWRLPATRRLAEQSMTGSAGQRRVPSSFLDRLEIPLPTLPEQQRWVRMLERADRLCRIRRYSLSIGESVLGAAFQQSFAASLQRGPFTPFGELVEITGGGTPPRDRPEYFEGSIPWLTSKDMRGDYIWDTEEHVTADAVRNSATKVVPADSVLVVVKSKVLMHRLPVAIAKVAMCHGQDIKSIQCHERTHHEFVRFMLKHHEHRLLSAARGANTEGLILPMLEDLLIPIVDYSDQLRFGLIAEQHERLRACQREALRQAELLFKTLLYHCYGIESA